MTDSIDAVLAQIANGGRHLEANTLRLRQLFSELTDEDRRLLLDQLAAQSADGSVPSLDALLMLIDHYRLAVGAIRSIVADNEAVNDAVQDTLIAVATSIGTYRSFRGWLAGVAKNQARQNIRRTVRQADREARAAEERPTVRISSLIASRQVVTETLADLPDAYRDAVVLRDLEQLTYEEISHRLNVELNTVRSRIARGRALVAAAVAP